MNKTSSDIGIIDTAEYKSGNIHSYAIVAMGVYLLANAVVVSGLLILGGGLILMPRVKRYLWHTPNIVSWGLMIVGVATLPA